MKRNQINEKKFEEMSKNEMSKTKAGADAPSDHGGGASSGSCPDCRELYCPFFHGPRE